MTRKMKIRIYPDGRVKAETEGFKGKGCRDYVRMLEEIIEGKAVDADYKPEYYEESTPEDREKLNQDIKLTD